MEPILSSPSKKTFLSGVFWKEKLGSIQAGQSATNLVEGLSWALFKKGRLRNIYEAFAMENKKLLQLIPYILASGRSHNEPGLLTKAKEDSRYALFLPHVELMEIADHPETGMSSIFTRSHSWSNNEPAQPHQMPGVW